MLNFPYVVVDSVGYAVAGFLSLQDAQSYAEEPGYVVLTRRSYARIMRARRTVASILTRAVSSKSQPFTISKL